MRLTTFHHPITVISVDFPQLHRSDTGGYEWVAGAENTGTRHRRTCTIPGIDSTEPAIDSIELGIDSMEPEKHEDTDCLSSSCLDVRQTAYHLRVLLSPVSTLRIPPFELRARSYRYHRVETADTEVAELVSPVPNQSLRAEKTEVSRCLVDRTSCHRSE